MDFDRSALIEAVAKDSEIEGQKENAIRLYDLALVSSRVKDIAAVSLW